MEYWLMCKSACHSNKGTTSAQGTLQNNTDNPTVPLLLLTKETLDPCDPHEV